MLLNVGLMYNSFKNTTFLVSSMLSPHKPKQTYKFKTKNQELRINNCFQNSTQLNYLNAAVRRKHTAHKANPVHTALSDSISDTQHTFQVTAACFFVGHYTECRTQKKYAPRKSVMLVRIQNPPQQETKVVNS